MMREVFPTLAVGEVKRQENRGEAVRKASSGREKVIKTYQRVSTGTIHIGQQTCSMLTLNVSLLKCKYVTVRKVLLVHLRARDLTQ